ncbi:MAG: DUF1579 family protein [Acidimicrobiia bacterium]|nr:DUF1579 family protein [Acidimicrobiia bacterium]
MTETSPCSTPEASQFDFWVGVWELSWPAEQTGGEPGELATGSNVIAHRFGKCVVEENFATGDGSFLGHSVSVYDEKASSWRQTWVDSSGGYLLFEGGMRDGVMELRTPAVAEEGEQIVQRMVFTDIEENSLTWHWQRSGDDGETWDELWTIQYRRRQQ